MRPIDADELKRQVKFMHKAVNTRDINPDYDTGFHSATSQMMGLIEYMPTVERPRGEWINEGQLHGCSNCGRYSKEYNKPFCCHCGADMRGEGE